MKKLLKFSVVLLLLTLVFACEKNESELVTPETKTNLDEKVLNQSIALNTICDIEGTVIVGETEDEKNQVSLCPGEIITIYYTSNFNVNSVQWDYPSGISLISSQGSSSATFRIDSNFISGTIEAIGEGELICSSKIYISCPDFVNDCGSINAITQLNALGDDDVRFFIPDGSLILDSGWTIQSYNWEFVCSSSGYSTTSSDERPFVDLSNCSGFWDVTVTITATNSAGQECYFSRTEQLQPGGTGGF